MTDAERERAAIADWLREEADKLETRASHGTHPLQRERLRDQAFMNRFIAKQIIDCRHHMTQAEYTAKFRAVLEGAHLKDPHP